MARSVSTGQKIAWTVVAWLIALVIFFPILYTVITSFKTEPEAIAGINLIPSGTFKSYIDVQTQRDYWRMGRAMFAAGRPDVAIVFLEGDSALIAQRQAARPQHYMPASLVASQFATLERPGADERVLEISVEPPAAEVLDAIVAKLG